MERWADRLDVIVADLEEAANNASTDAEREFFVDLAFDVEDALLFYKRKYSLLSCG